MQDVYIYPNSTLRFEKIKHSTIYLNHRFISRENCRLTLFLVKLFWIIFALEAHCNVANVSWKSESIEKKESKSNTLKRTSLGS